MAHIHQCVYQLQYHLSKQYIVGQLLQSLNEYDILLVCKKIVFYTTVLSQVIKSHHYLKAVSPKEKEH